MKTALITGITGQDGDYLAELGVDKHERLALTRMMASQGAAR